MNLKKLFNSLTDSSKVLLTVGGVSLLLDFVGQGELDKKLAAGLGAKYYFGGGSKLNKTTPSPSKPQYKE